MTEYCSIISFIWGYFIPVMALYPPRFEPLVAAAADILTLIAIVFEPFTPVGVVLALPSSYILICSSGPWLGPWLGDRGGICDKSVISNLYWCCPRHTKFIIVSFSMHIMLWDPTPFYNWFFIFVNTFDAAHLTVVSIPDFKTLAAGGWALQGMPF